MKKLDIEAFLDGSLTPAELEEFNMEMHRNPAFAKQVEARREWDGHLRTQLLREQVKAVLSEKPQTGRPQRWTWLAGIVLLIVLTGGLLYWLNKPANLPTAPVPPSNTEQKTETPTPTQPTPDEKQPDTDQKREKAADTPRRPIASDLPPPEFTAPTDRGQNKDTRAWKTLLDQVWYTKFPPENTRFNAPFTEAAQLLIKRDFTAAFVQLEIQERQQTENDTMRFLKGYCLLEMGEGADALRYLEQLEEHQPGWKAQLQWYRGLALLLTGEAQKAMPQFREIANTPGHPFRVQSQKALELLE